MSEGAMRELVIDRVTARGWCAAMMAALALALCPGAVRAGQPEPAPMPEIDPTPVAIEAPPEPEPIEPAPAPQPIEAVPEPPPIELPPAPEVPAPIAAEEGPTPAEAARLEAMRKAGVGVMASGGAVAVVGLGMTVGFAIVGRQALNAEEPVSADIERSNTLAQAGGALLASGIAIVAIGGIVFATAKRKAESRTTARVQVTPALGGVVVSGRF